MGGTGGQALNAAPPDITCGNKAAKTTCKWGSIPLNVSMWRKRKTDRVSVTAPKLTLGKSRSLLRASGTGKSNRRLSTRHAMPTAFLPASRRDFYHAWNPSTNIIRKQEQMFLHGASVFFEEILRRRERRSAEGCGERPCGKAPFGGRLVYGIREGAGVHNRKSRSGEGRLWAGKFIFCAYCKLPPGSAHSPA